MRKAKLTTKDCCYIGIFTALTVILAQISIPMPMGVPMTMQTFAITLAGMMLGARKGFLAALAYILLGAFGMPVFHNFTGGIGSLVGPTGGFILSFPLMAWLIGLGAEKLPAKTGVVLGLLFGTVLNYICGTVMFCAVTGSSLQAALVACVVPFIPTAIVKAVCAGLLGIKLRARLLLFI